MILAGSDNRMPCSSNARNIARLTLSLKARKRRGELKLGPLSMVRQYDDFVDWLAHLPERESAGPR